MATNHDTEDDNNDPAPIVWGAVRPNDPCEEHPSFERDNCPTCGTAANLSRWK